MSESCECFLHKAVYETVGCYSTAGLVMMGGEKTLSRQHWAVVVFSGSCACGP